MNATVCDLSQGKCKPCEGGIPALDAAAVGTLMQQLTGWSRIGHAIAKTYHFADYHQTMSFVNATAWISNREGHHPDLHVGYNQCTVSYVTHAVGGLTENDFICAAKIDALFAL